MTDSPQARIIMDNIMAATAVKIGPATFAVLRKRLSWMNEDERRLDRALQRLRRKGTITFSKGRWEIAQ